MNEEKDHVPEMGIEPVTLQISQKQGKLDLNAITIEALVTTSLVILWICSILAKGQSELFNFIEICIRP